MKILLVDDETDVEVLFAQRFRKEIARNELEFTFASSGSEALTRLNNQPRDIKIVLSDINMPGMSGLELLEKIKKRADAPGPKVMMISAYGDQENYDQSVNLGADGFLTKPVDFSILKEKLNSLRLEAGQ